MKKAFSFFTALMLVVSALIPYPVLPAAQASATVSSSLPLNENLADWILDKGNNKIYAITSSGNLHFISLDTFSIEHSLFIGANPTDLELDQGKLYVSFGDTYNIKIVDLSTKNIISEFSVTNSPYKIAVDDSKIFYVEEDQHSSVYAYVYGEGTEEEITVQGDHSTSYYEPEIFIDKRNDILYIGESATSGAQIDAISTIDYSVKSKSNYDDGYGFSYPERKLIMDNGEIFYAGKRLDANNLEIIKGTYTDDDYLKETAIEVVGNYVFTTNDIFERMTFKKRAELPFETDFILATGLDDVYMFNPDDQTIYKYSFELPSVNQSTSTANNSLLLNDKLVDWELDEASNKLYAIAKDSNTLYYIDAETLAIEHQKFVGSLPTDIDLVNNQLYIANSGATTITIESTAYQPTVTDDIYNEPVDYLITGQNPYSIETDGNSLFYAVEDQHAKVFHIDLATQSEQQVVNDYNNLDEYYEPYLLLNPFDNTLYIGESSISGGDIYKIDASTFEVLDFSTYGFFNPARKVILSGNDIFYAKHQINKDDLTSLLNVYNETILHVDNNYVYTTSAVYDRSTAAKVADFPCPVKLVTSDSQGRIFVHPENSQSIYRFDSIESLQLKAPTNFTAEFNDNEDFVLNWDSTTPGYQKVEYKTSSMYSFETLKDLLGESQYIVPESQFKQWYGETVTFRVTSSICDQVSEAATVSYTFELVPPEGLQLITNDQNEYLLSWTPVPHMDGYNLYYLGYYDIIPNTLAQNVTDNTLNVTDYVYGEWQGENITFGISSVVYDKQSTINYDFSVTFDVYNEPSQDNNDSNDSNNEDNNDSNTNDSNNNSNNNSNNDTPSQNNDDDSDENNEDTNGDSSEEESDDQSALEKIIEKIIEDIDGSTTAEIDVDVFDKTLFVKRTTTLPKEVYEFERENETDYVDFSISKSFIDEALKQEGDEKYLLIRSNRGYYELPLELSDFSDISEDAKIEVSINKTTIETQERLQETIEQHDDLKLISTPLDYKVRIIEEDTVTTIETFGSKFVERSIYLGNDVNPENTVVITYVEDLGMIMPVLTRVEVDEEGNVYAIFNRNGNSTYAAVQTTSKTFKDIQNHWTKEFVEDLAEDLIIMGKNDATFGPNEQVTRAQYTVLLTRTLGLTPSKNIEIPFADVSEGDWYYHHVQAAMQANLLDGFEGEKFNPNKGLTREEMIEMTVRALEFVNGEIKADIKILNSFNDTDTISEDAKLFVAKAVKAGIIRGTSQNYILPERIAKRGESAVVLKKLIDSFYFNQNQ